MKNQESKFNKYFLLSWRKVWMVVVGWFVAVMLHNLVYALFGFEEALFFIIAVIAIPIYVLFVLIYNVVKLVRKKFKK